MDADSRQTPGVTFGRDELLGAFHIEANYCANGVMTVTAAGELDLAASPVFSRVIDACCARKGLTTLVIDVRELRFIDVAGLSALIAAQERARVLGGGLVLIGPSHPVERLLQLAKMDDELILRNCAG
jgi:anti-sigma B factor antagonist